MHLVIRDLSKSYPNGTHALKDVSLDLPPGMFGLLGRNGAGKSTLMRILATLQEPDEGSVRLGDVDVLRQKDEVRNETELPMDDFVEIGAFAAGEGGEPGAPLYLKPHRIRSGEQTIRITVQREPARAGIDPHRKLIDRDRADNVVAVKAPGAH